MWTDAHWRKIRELCKNHCFDVNFAFVWSLKMPVLVSKVITIHHWKERTSCSQTQLSVLLQKGWNVFSLCLFWQISTDVETGKTKISRINGSIHTIPGKEVGHPTRHRLYEYNMTALMISAKYFSFLRWKKTDLLPHLLFLLYEDD